jgi:hypothetical protein
MPPTMRPTGLASPVDQRQDYTVYSGEWPMGPHLPGARDARRHGMVLVHLRNSSHPPDVHTNGHAPTLEAAKADLEASWRKWLDWAELNEGT